MIKRLLLGIFAVVVVAAVLGVLFVSNLDLNLYKQKIQQAVFDKTGRQLNIEGEISASFFPWAGLQLNDVALADAEGFGDQPFAKVRSSDVKLKLLPLLVGTYTVDLIQLDGLQLNLQINEDGVANWEDLLASTTVVETQTGDDDVLQAVETGAPLAAALSVGGIKITDARVMWQDKKNAVDITLARADLTTDAIQLGQPFDVDTRFDIESQSYGFSSQVEASGAVDLDLATNSYALSGLQLNTNNSGRIVPIAELPVIVSGDLSASLNAQTFDFTNLGIHVAGVPLQGEVHGTGLRESLNIFGTLGSSEFDAAGVIDGLGVVLPQGLDRQLLKAARLDLAFQQSQQQLLFDRLDLTVGDIEIAGNLQVANLDQSPVVSGKFSTNTFVPAPWLKSIAVVASDPLVMQSASVSMGVRQSGQLLAFNDVQLKVDDLVVSGNVELTDINAAVPPVVFELHGTSVDVDRYLPRTELAEGAPQTSSDNPTPLPIDDLRSLNINGEITFDQLTYAGVSLSDLVLPVRTDAGKLEISEARAALYEGSIFGGLTLDLNGEEPLLTVSSNINAVQSAPLIADYLKTESPVSGTGIVNLDMLTRGDTVQQWLRQVDGALSVRFTDGSLNGINIGREVRRVSAALEGADFAGSSDSQQTDFTELSVSAELKDGVLHSDDLSLKSPLLRVTGKGVVDLPEQQIDYLAQVLITGSAQGQGGAEMAALDGLRLPVPVSGTFNDLSVNFSDMLINGLRSDFTQQLDTLKNSLQKATQQELDQQQEKMEELIEDNKEVVLEQVQQKKEQLDEQLQETRQGLQDSLQNTLEKGLSDLLKK